jgi:hypothetical protein
MKLLFYVVLSVATPGTCIGQVAPPSLQSLQANPDGIAVDSCRYASSIHQVQSSRSEACLPVGNTGPLTVL